MNWKQFIDSLKAKSQMLASMLSMGVVAAVDDNKITVAFTANGANKQVLEKVEHKTTIEDTLREFFKLAVRIEYVLDKTKKPPGTKAGKPRELSIDADDILAKDPELKRVVERFDGEIISRRKTDK